MWIVVLLVVAIVGYVFLKTKLNNFISRGEQHLLGKVGLDSSSVSKKMTGPMDKKLMGKFLNDFPAYTDDTVRGTFRSMSESIVNKVRIASVPEELAEKIQNNRNYEHLTKMKYDRTTIVAYNSKGLFAMVTYADSRDELALSMRCNVENDLMILTQCDLSKSSVKG